jgi:hypothetical protein
MGEVKRTSGGSRLWSPGLSAGEVIAGEFVRKRGARECVESLFLPASLLTSSLPRRSSKTMVPKAIPEESLHAAVEF